MVFQSVLCGFLAVYILLNKDQAVIHCSPFLSDSYSDQMRSDEKTCTSFILVVVQEYNRIEVCIKARSTVLFWLHKKSKDTKLSKIYTVVNPVGCIFKLISKLVILESIQNPQHFALINTHVIFFKSYLIDRSGLNFT